MKHYFPVFLLIVCISCSNKKKTDEYLLGQDKKILRESLDTPSVNFYRFFKVILRASAKEDSIPEELGTFQADLDIVSSKIHNTDSSRDLSITDYLAIYRSFRKMESFIRKTDEDNFPTLTETFITSSSDSIHNPVPKLKGTEKLRTEAIEHAVLSAITLFSKDFGKEITLYECSKIKPGYLPDSEIKPLIRLIRGMIFFQKGLFYLSEDELTRNIAWLNSNNEIELPITSVFFQWQQFNNDQVHIALHSVNHLFRGIDRLLMEREIDKKRALEDFEAFLKDSYELGFDNEVTWAVETYLYLKNGDSEKAIVSLNKLKASKLLPDREKKKIDEAIFYLNKRKSRKTLNGILDKFFFAKITTSYFFDILSEIEWKKTLDEKNITHTDKIFNTIQFYGRLSSTIDKYTSKETLKETAQSLKEKGKGLLKPD